MNYKAITKESKRYKGNLHSHTTHSDGYLTPKEAKEYYKKNGYSFMAFTDHEVYSDFREELNDDDFIIIPGIEASSNLVKSEDIGSGKNNIWGARPKNHHVLGLLGPSSMQKKATKEIFKHLEKVDYPVFYDNWDGLKAAQELVNSLYERGLVVTYNHPLWSRVDFEEFADLENIFALEIYNYGTEIECALGNDTFHWDQMLASKKKILGFASDDNHNQAKLPDSFGGAIVVCPSPEEDLSHDSIMENILAGNFYSTSGIDIIEWGIKEEDGKKIAYVECDPVRMIHFIVGGKVGDGETIYCQDREETITKGEYTLKGSENYIRIECVDKYGRKAWTNPYYI